MTDCCEIDVEVDGSIGISNTEETTTESREDSIAKEVSALEKTSRRRAVKKTVVCKTFKSIVFLICLIFLIIQSVEFFNVYYKYPTTIVTEVTVSKEFKLPAITLCFRNTISFKDFCSYEPDQCEKPRNMEEFCRKHVRDCSNGTTNSKIPTKKYDTREAMQRYLFNDSYNNEDLVWSYEYASKARTFIIGYKQGIFFLKCYSDNLHLYQSRSKPETLKLDFTKKTDGLFSALLLHQRVIEPFYPIDGPQVFVAIHSPYVPINFEDLHAIIPGKEYVIYVQLEKEEHLLPPPYQTDCAENGPSEDAKASTNTNSFQMCLDMCRSEYAKARYGCDVGMRMVSSVRDLCLRNHVPPHITHKQQSELQNNLLICFQNCKQGCLKLQYKYRIKETEDYEGKDLSLSVIEFYVKNPEVTVLMHVPLYSSSEIFSHVGGLLGCWLGISVFIFTGIMEKFFRKVFKWRKRFGRRKKKRASTSEIHQY